MFEALIESYNAGSRNIEQLFEELIKLSNSIDAEEPRHVRENLSEEEPVIFFPFLLDEPYRLPLPWTRS